MLYVTLVSLMILLSVSLAAFAAAAPVPRMSTDDLKSRLDDEGLIVLDVRASRDWNGSNDKIEGAQRIDQKKLGTWADNQAKGQTIVLYCA
jgi:rhodanese-related sulfurtransferase